MLILAQVVVVVFLLLVEPAADTKVFVRVVAGHGLGGHSSIGVAEVNIAHVISVVKEIRVQGIVVPEVVEIVLSSPMSLYHVVEEARHAEEDVGPEDGAHHVEV